MVANAALHLRELRASKPTIANRNNQLFVRCVHRRASTFFRDGTKVAAQTTFVRRVAHRLLHGSVKFREPLSIALTITRARQRHVPWVID